VDGAGLPGPTPPRGGRGNAAGERGAGCELDRLVVRGDTLGNPIALFVPGEVAGRRARRRECQRRMTRLQVGALLEAYALEATDPALGREWRRRAFWVGWMAALVADESTLDFRTLAAHQAMREDMQSLARAATAAADLTASLDRLLIRYVGPRRDEFL